MSEKFDKAIEGLRQAQVEGVNIMLDNIRRRAYYPDLASMENRTRQIMMAQAALPVGKEDAEKVHLIRHIEMLRKELRKQSDK